VSAFTFDSTFPDGSPRRMAGTHRPTFDEARRRIDSMTSDQFNSFTTSYPSNQAASFEEWAWRNGRFDAPIYHLEEWEQ
jgi:hypothetical protein